MRILKAVWGNNDVSWSLDDTIRGSVKFRQNHAVNCVRVFINLTGVPPGMHGIHIHEKGMNCKEQTMTDNPCGCTSGHFNPTNEYHGKHCGDLCFNILANDQGVVKYEYFDEKLCLFDESLDIQNITVVIHEDPDDLGILGKCRNDESLKTGNAGNRIACAEIHEHKFFKK